MNEYKKLKHPFKKDSIKGESGCTLVIGGSKYYTGAPYFAALGALRTGSDLVYILCQKEAEAPLKTLLPEAIVTVIHFEEHYLRKITACVIGPGLGIIEEEGETFTIIKKIVKYLEPKRIPIILDGDGLRLYHHKIFKEYPLILITPNINERKKTVWLEPKHLLIEKGRRDIIRLEEKKEIIYEEGILRRCGGQGDILVGMLCTFLSWSKDKSSDDMIASAKAACILVRKASKKAEEENGFSVIASDILRKIPEVLNEVICEE